MFIVVVERHVRFESETHCHWAILRRQLLVPLIPPVGVALRFGDGDGGYATCDEVEWDCAAELCRVTMRHPPDAESYQDATGEAASIDQFLKLYFPLWEVVSRYREPKAIAAASSSAIIA